jgi:outer membrane biosynthesis protein TonB
MVNHRILPRIGVIVFAVSLFSSSIFSGLVATPSPSFPLNSALASTTGTDTEDETQSPRLAPEGTLPDEPEVVEPPPPPPPPPDDETPDVEPPTVADPTPDDGQPPPPTEPPITNGTTPTNGTTTGGNQTTVSNNTTFTQSITGLRLQDRISVQIQPSACTTGSDSEHWNKIVFRIARDPTGRIDSSLINTELEILERVHDGGVLNLKDIVRYSIVNEPGILPQLTFEEADRLEIEIMDV